MCMPEVFADAPGVPHHWHDHYYDGQQPFHHPSDFLAYVATPVRTRVYCLFDKPATYIAEPHVIPIGHQPKFGINLYALGLELLILGLFIAPIVIGQRRIKKSDQPRTKRLWRAGQIIALMLMISFITFIIWATLRRLGVFGTV